MGKRYKIEVNTADNIARGWKYNRIDHQRKIGMVRYSNGSNRINIYLTKATVVICKPGKPLQVVKRVTLQHLYLIFRYGEPSKYINPLTGETNKQRGKTVEPEEPDFFRFN